MTTHQGQVRLPPQPSGDLLRRRPGHPFEPSCHRRRRAQPRPRPPPPLSPTPFVNLRCLPGDSLRSFQPTASNRTSRNRTPHPLPHPLPPSWDWKCTVTTVTMTAPLLLSPLTARTTTKPTMRRR